MNMILSIYYYLTRIHLKHTAPDPIGSQIHRLGAGSERDLPSVNRRLTLT